MKRIFTILFFLHFANSAYPQAPNWLWAVNSSGGGQFQEGKGISVNPVTGDIYFAARLSATVTMAGQSATGNADDDPSIGKLKTDGTGVWYQADNYNNGGFNYIYAFYRDDSDNTYSTGQLQSIQCMYFNKYNSAGIKQWGKTVPGADASGYGIITDKTGNIYVSGEYRSSMNFGSTTLNYKGNGSDQNTFLAKYDKVGTFLWAVGVSGTAYVGGRNLTLDMSGNVYMCGVYTGAATFGSNVTPVAATGSNLFVAMFDPSNGNNLWVNTAAGAGYTHYYRYWEYWSITSDSCANLYITGHYAGTAKFDNQTITSAGNDDVFLAKCSGSGSWVWVKSAGGPNDDQAFGIAIDQHNEIYIGGLFSGTAQFDGQSVTSAGNNDVFVAKYSSLTGDLVWVQRGGGPANESIEGLSVDGQGFVYIVGGSDGNSVFGSTNLPGQFEPTIVVAKLDTIPVRGVTAKPDSFYCPGANANLPYTVTRAFNPGNIFTAELSDSSGNFSLPITIGTVTATTNGSISIIIPSNTPGGTHYQIRIVSSSPVSNGFSSCSAVSYINIGNILVPKVSADTSVCSGSSVQLNVSGGGSFSWSPGKSLNDSTVANPIATPLTSQTYTVTVGSGNCLGKGNVAIVVSPSVNIMATPHDTSICGNVSVSLSATGATSYKWTPGTFLDNSTSANPVASPTISITYVVSGGICNNPDSVIIRVGNTTAGGHIKAIRDTICKGTRGSLTLSGNSSNIIQWQSSLTDNDFSDISNAVDTLKYRTFPLDESTYYRCLTGSGNCSAISDTLLLYVPPELIAKFNSSSLGNNVDFNSDSSFGNIRSYHWEFGDGNTSNDKNPTHVYDKDSIYYVCLTLYDGSNCSYTFCRYTEVTDAVNTLSASGSCSVYPNPFNNQLIIHSSQTNNSVQSVQIYDVLGRIIIYQTFGNINQQSLIRLNVSSLADGIYYVKLQLAHEDYMAKLVK